MKNLLLIFFFLIGSTTYAQDDSVPPPVRQDTIPVIRPAPVRPRPVQTPAFHAPQVSAASDSLSKDSLLRAQDSLSRIYDSVALDTLRTSIPGDSVVVSLKYAIGSDSARFLNTNFFPFTNPVRYTVTSRKWEGKEQVFYIVISLLILFALLRNAFHRYVGDLFRVYFRTTMRQRQIREQMLQSPLPSLLFNIFFVMSGGVYSALKCYHFRWVTHTGLLHLALYCALALTVIYAVKFLVLRLIGWILQASDTAQTYIFIVFTSNKIIGIVLLPFIVLLAFTYGNIYLVAANLSLLVLGLLFVYRYFIAFITVGRTLRIHFLHFLLYMAALEVLPLLVINKLLVISLRHLY